MVFRFINGLNETFFALRSQVTMMEPFPILNEVYNLVLREKTQRNLMLQLTPIIESSTMAVTTDNKKKGRTDLTCSHCGKKKPCE